MRPPLHRIALSLVAAASFSAAGCGGGGSGNHGLSSSPQVSTYDSDVATAWFDLLYTEVKAGIVGPPPASRIYGYCALGLYETLAPGMSDHQTLQGQLNNFPAGTIPTPANARHHWPAAANRCLAVLAAHFMPAGQTDYDALEAAQLAAFEVDEPDQAVIDRSVQWGEDVANAIAAFADADGFAGLVACNGAFVAPVDPASGGWVPTAGGQGLGAFPCWGTLPTFAVTDADECVAFGAPAYSTSTSSSFYAQALVNYNSAGDAGASLSADENALSFFWADNAGVTGTPGGHWISIVHIIATQQSLKLDTTAEAYARVGIAIHDAFITCWRTKYDTYLLRPVSYIQANIDPTWDPLIGTPGFPTYTSGHSTQSAAAAAVLTNQFGPLAFTDTTHTDLDPTLGFPDRSFDNFNAAAVEAAFSRLCAGIHYQFDNQDGFGQGSCVGEIVNSRVHFRTE